MLKKYFLTLAAICLPHLIITDDQKISVKSRYPQAYAWYRDLATKYPTANLSSIEFCISDHHHAGSGVIFWPEQNLKIIDLFYGSSSITPKIQQLMLEDEYLLLHEACHVLNGHTTKGTAAIVAATTASAGLTLGLTAQMCAQAIPAVTAVAQGALGHVALAAGIFAYARAQERQADDFANQTADQASLQAGAAWHQNNHNELQIPETASPLLQTYIEISSDKAHPAPQERLSSSLQALEKRFNTPSTPAIA